MLRIQTFADLDAERKKLGFSARAVCARSGYHYVTWSRWRNGVSEIKLNDFNTLIGVIEEMAAEAKKGSKAPRSSRK